jgi:glutaredoxin
MMNKDNELYLYTRPDCPLCETFRQELDKRGFGYLLIDIEKDPELQHRYGARIPVLVAGRTEICEGKYDSQRIDALIVDV